MSDTTAVAVSVSEKPAPPSAPPQAPREEIPMREGLPAVEVRRLLALAARRHETGARQLAFYLVEMEERRLYQETGHDSTAFYAEARLALDRRRTSELLRIGRTLLELRDVDAAFCDGRLSWSKVLILAGVVTPKYEAEWLERALALDCRALAALARTSKPGGPPRKPGNTKGLPEIRFPLGMRVGVVEHALIEQAQAKLSAELDRQIPLTELFLTLCSDFLTTEADGSMPGRKRVDSSLYRVILRNEGSAAEPCLVVDTDEGPLPVDEPEMLCCDAQGLRFGGESQAEIDVKTPPELRRMILLRDGVRCRACTSRKRLMAHHIEYRSEGGPTSPENLISLCFQCHGMVHGGRLVLRGETADAVRFTDCSGVPLVHREPGDPIPAPAPAAAAASRILPADVDAFAGMVERDGVLTRLKTVTEGARRHGLVFPHMLITGNSGLGKSRLARTVAAAMGRRPVEVLAPMVRSRHALLDVFASLEDGDVVVLDEAHALPKALFPVLHEALAEARLGLPKFTLVAVTTFEDALPNSLRSRFPLREELRSWDRDALASLVEHAAAARGVGITSAAAALIALHTVCSPLAAERLLDLVLRVRVGGPEAALDRPAVAAALPHVLRKTA
jgi:hypothetical protein